MFVRYDKSVDGLILGYILGAAFIQVIHVFSCILQFYQWQCYLALLEFRIIISFSEGHRLLFIYLGYGGSYN